MFKELGALMKLMGQGDKIKEEMQNLQTRLAEITAEGDAGGGMVKVKANGKMEIVSCTISEEARADREMLEELGRAAVNQAIQKARLQGAEETTKMAANLGLPPGMLPGV
jgi:DNA-binding YbaB/EbfC family protein